MNLLLIVGAGIIACLVLVAGIAIVNANTSDDPAAKEGTCSSTCGSSCTAENNCGLATCGAVTGGSCGCR